MGAVWDNQVLAVQCFLGTEPLPPNCRPTAMVLTLSFVMLYGIVSYLLLLLIKHQSAMFQTIVTTLSTPTFTATVRPVGG